MLYERISKNKQDFLRAKEKVTVRQKRNAENPQSRFEHKLMRNISIGGERTEGVAAGRAEVGKQTDRQTD